MAHISGDTDIQYMKGVGPQRAEGLKAVGIHTVSDLLYFLPRRYIDRSMITPIGKVRSDREVTIIGKVLGKGILHGRVKRLEVVIGDDTGYLSLIWFNRPYQLEKRFKKGDVYAVSGQVTYFKQFQIVHPEIERINDEDDHLIHTGRIVPVYPSTAGLKSSYITGRVMRTLVNQALERVGGKIEDPLPDDIRREQELYDLKTALKQVHYPGSNEKAEKARKRLAFDELLALQYMILLFRKEKSGRAKQFKYGKPGEIVEDFRKALPFEMTVDQGKAVKKIFGDQRLDRPMNRLLQGDVGCGKTVVAIMAAVFAAENRLQSAFMAPTELLAEQHYRSWKDILAKIGVQAELLTGSLKAGHKSLILEELQSGDVDILFGTHALLSDPVVFPRLGLVVIDEQHRFGVMQRGKLIGKGNNPDLLVMTATPIPRTLALTLYGDLDITSIKTMPPGRQETRTVWRTADSREELYKYLEGRIKKGEQTFIIYPLVEKSKKIDLQAAEDEYKKLKKDIFPDFRVGLVHGQMPAEKRDRTILRFREGKYDILVATTVIEVGIDIPSANIMIIEHAERFGLSQLHQLRGRVGRGGRQGLAVAVATPPLSELSKKRLEMFTATTDGFKIAAADLELRGPGEFFGTRQHGLPELKTANLAADADLLGPARDLAADLLAGDKTLDKDRRNLLSYLEKRVAIKKRLVKFG